MTVPRRLPSGCNGRRRNVSGNVKIPSFLFLVDLPRRVDNCRMFDLLVLRAVNLASHVLFLVIVILVLEGLARDMSKHGVSVSVVRV